MASGSAKAQNLKFYYYPDNNVYYDVASHQYVYLNNGAWTTVQTLPSGITLVKSPRYVVYNPTKEVWRNNAVHIKKYPKGKAVGYKGTNPNKANGQTKPKSNSKN